jgi:acetyl-CoA acetyltransferase family protein
MKQPVIVAGVRTPIGRAHDKRGAYRNVRSDRLGVAVVRALLARTGIAPAEVEDVHFGCAQQYGEQGSNVARFIALAAGLPPETAANTANRLCGSSLETLRAAAHAIVAGEEDVHVVGGIEHMHHFPIDRECGGKPLDIMPEFAAAWTPAALTMGWATDLMAQELGISRRQQDEYALRSHQRATAAQAAGQFATEIVPVEVENNGRKALVEQDQCIRPDTSLERLAELQPAFIPVGGTITAGNSAALSDGAAALLVMSREKACALGLRPLARVVATAVAGVRPTHFGLGPVPATQRALERAGLTLADIDLVELNEAFAAQVIACLRELPIAEDKLNVAGGALAIGHPLGASGARIVTTLLHNLRRRDATLGLATMCVGYGQGIAVVLERIE